MSQNSKSEKISALFREDIKAHKTSRQERGEGAVHCGVPRKGGGGGGGNGGSSGGGHVPAPHKNT